MELSLQIPTINGEAPLRLFLPTQPRRGVILVYHGLGAIKEVQRKECKWLAESGFLAVAVDAVGHGARKLPDFEWRMTQWNHHYVFLQMVHDSIREIPAIIDALSALLGENRFGVTGVSMGGYIAFGAATIEPRLRAVVPILGSPDWTVGAQHYDELLQQSPHTKLGAFPPRAILAINAARDTNVPPQATRTLIEGLRPHYTNDPERLQYIEYPNSSHFMREEDWFDLWQRAIGWLTKVLSD
jgi:dienelactone hydrolase